LIETLFNRVPELAKYIRVLHGDGSVGEELVKLAPDFIFLTGSTETGRKVLSAAAGNLIPVACEMGGKDAVIVLEDADVSQASRWTVWGAFYNTGQTCMGIERVYVVEPCYDEFIKNVLKATHDLNIGYTQELESANHIGPMTDPRQVEIIDRHLQDALAKGAHILTGGDRQGMFIQPMVLVDVDHRMLIMREETFGPVLSIMKVKDENEAIRLANDSLYGLGGSVWGRDLHRAWRVARQLQAGSILINDTIVQIAIPMLPFGGVKNSGNGRVHGREGLLQFTKVHAYAVGSPPNPLDLSVILRKPGHYHFGRGLWRILFGMTLRQRWQGIADLISKH
jgi:succinate-semialdehyde dehydrogenase/glutarate-semialdehyde dehydrogenase